MRNKKLSAVCFSLVMLVILSMVENPVVFAAVQKYEKELKIVGGNNRDLRTFTYNGHIVSEGFAATVTTMRPVRPNEESFSKAGIAVSLGAPWFEGEGVGAYDYFPFVKEMWIKIAGDSNFRNEVHPNGIATNIGTGANCTVSWMLVLDILEMILPSILEKLFEAPPAKEWQSDLHWLKAIVRQDQPPEDILGQWHPILRTAACDFDILFQNVLGYQYLTVTAGAAIWLEIYREGREVPTIWYYYIGDYSVSFTVEVLVTNEPNDPSTPSGYTSGYTGQSYIYSTSAVDPNGDNVRYQFDWGDSSTTTTGWYASGFTASASHTWVSSGTYYVTVRAQDVYEEWSNWSPYLTVTISSGGGGGGGCPTLFVWNGNGYVDYGVINIHNPTGEDVIREVPIQSEDVCINSHKAKFRFREGWEGLNFSESVIDQVRLYSVDSQGNRHLCPLISAEHSRLGNVLPQLLLSDDYRAQMLLLETVDLTFMVPWQNIQGFTFAIEGCNFSKW
jgi:hypothetical protein